MKNWLHFEKRKGLMYPLNKESGKIHLFYYSRRYKINLYELF